MPFFIIGLLLFTTGLYFYRLAKINHDKEGLYGSMILMIVGGILAIGFGLFYRLLTLNI